MKLKYLIAAAFLCLPVPAMAFPQGGISPCVIAAQPGDLVLTGASLNVHLNTCGETLIVLNNGNSDARIRFGATSATTALVTDMVIPHGTQQTFNVGTSGLWIAGIGTTTLSFILGTTVQ